MTDVRSQAICWAFGLAAVAFVLLCPPCSLLWRALAWAATGEFF